MMLVSAVSSVVLFGFCGGLNVIIVEVVKNNRQLYNMYNQWSSH